MAAMPRSTPFLLALVAAACGSAPKLPPGTYDPALVQSQKDLAAMDAHQKDFNNVLLQLDTALDSYVRALSNKGVQTFDAERERLDKFLRQTVSGDPPGSNTRRLMALASDGSDRIHQGIALAALGFAEQPGVMPIILAGAQLKDPFLVDRAILGLAVLADPQTPPGIIAAAIDDPDHPEQGRILAAWTLFELQPNNLRGNEIIEVWKRILNGPATEHPLIVATAVRGLGLTRDAKYADLVVRQLANPTARVRMNAAIALGRMNAQSHYSELIALLGPAETVGNVRLHARKALQALSGGADRGYDEAQWRRLFERNGH